MVRCFVCIEPIEPRSAMEVATMRFPNGSEIEVPTCPNCLPT